MWHFGSQEEWKIVTIQIIIYFAIAVNWRNELRQAEASGIDCYLLSKIHGTKFVRHYVNDFKNLIESR